MGKKYSTDELYTATEVARNFSSVLKSIKNRDKEKIVIVKNNKFEAVMLSVEDYEKLKDAFDILQVIYKKNKKA